MIELRGLTTCVGYADLLRITLPANMRHLSECLVVTSPEDHATAAVVAGVSGARLHVTDAFTRHGSYFNKGLGIEESFDVLDRHGWLVIWDADIIFPAEIPYIYIRPGCLHGARRRILTNPREWHAGLEWKKCPMIRDGGPVGFFQLFQGDDPAIRDKRPWYDVSFTHAGGGDAYFINHWHPNQRRILPIDCLHLGPKDTNWFGTGDEARDLMAAFIIRNGWLRSHPKVDLTADKRVGEIRERVEVPGYPASGFELPFVQRAKRLRK